jgi:hypothetical protein
MSHAKQVAQALGRAAQNKIPKLGLAKPTDREVAERTFLAIQKTIEEKDRWHQSETRDVLKFKDKNGVVWYLTIANKHARLRLVLVHTGNGSNLGWRSETLLVGWPIKKENGRIGFALTTEFAQFAQWRKSVMRKRPVTRPSPKSC